MCAPLPACLADLGYDANGNVIHKTTPGGSTSFTYDPLDRLDTESGPAGTRNHDFDPNGNRTTDGAGTTAAYSPNSDRIQTINGIGVTLDAAGNLTSDGTYQYLWNGLGQLAELRKPDNTLIASYYYDHQNLRTRKLTTAAAPQGVGKTFYHYDQAGHLIAETAPGNAIFPAQPFCKNRSGEWPFLIFRLLRLVEPIRECRGSAVSAAVAFGYRGHAGKSDPVRRVDGFAQMLSSHASPLNLLHRGISLTGFLKAVWDPAVTVITLGIVSVIYGEDFDGPEILLAVIAFSVLYPGSIALHKTVGELLREVILQWLPTVAILFLLGSSTHYLELFHPKVLETWALTVPAVWFVSHLVFPVVAPRLFAIEGVRRAVIIGASPIGRRLADQFVNQTHLGVELLGFFDDRSVERLGELDNGRLLGRLDNIAEYTRQARADAIFIALPMASQPRILKLLDDLKDSTASIYFVPDIFVADLIQARVDEIGGMPVVAVCETPFYGINALIKRASDIVIASLILVLIAPLMLLIAIAVKFSSPGPVLFRQRRYGLDGQEIIVYKFRSMTVCEDGAVIEQARKEDKRVTPIGAILRRTSLDELPQFINVLQGRMSVVGPRPHAVAHNELYRDLVKGYMVRHKVRPGITGLAQVSGCRGETETVDKMQKRIEYDLEYLRKWSLRLDLEVILRTVAVLFKDRQAY